MEESSYRFQRTVIFLRNNWRFLRKQSQMYKERLHNSEKRCLILKITVRYFQNNTTFLSGSVDPVWATVLLCIMRLLVMFISAVCVLFLIKLTFIILALDIFHFYTSLSTDKHSTHIYTVCLSRSPIANMAACARKRGFSVTTVAKGKLTTHSLYGCKMFTLC